MEENKQPKKFPWRKIFKVAGVLLIAVFSALNDKGKGGLAGEVAKKLDNKKATD